MALTKIRGNTQIKSSTITNVEIAANAGIELSKLAEGAELIKRDGSVAFTGNVNLDGHKLVNVASPTSATDAANMGYVDVEVAAVQAEVDAEELARAAADTQLQANIDAEALARANADTTLQGNIDSEAAARAAADLVLQGNIDAEAATRSADDIALQANIDAEALARAAADSALDSRVTTAESDIVALEGRMDTAEADIDALESRASTLENGLQAETAARIADVDAEEARALAAEGVLQDNIDAEELRAMAAESALQAEIDAEEIRAAAAEAAIQAELDAEEARALAAEGVLQSNINSEAATRLAADTALDGRLVKAEENLAFPVDPLFENNASVYADARPGVVDPSAAIRDGWYFQNSTAGHKINWYYYDGSVNNVTVADFSTYAVVTVDSLSSLPFIAVYTTGTDNGWYKSKKVFYMPSNVVVGKQYLMYVGQNPNVHTDIPHVACTPGNATGAFGAAERVLTVAMSSNSGAAVNNVKMLVERLGVNAPSYKQEYELRIRHATQVALDAEAATRLANDNTLQANINAEASARQAADANLQSQINQSNANASALEARVTTAEGDIDSLEARMTTAEGDINTLEANLAQELLDRAAGDASTLASAQAYADQKISDLVDGAPALLDTLNELAAAIGDDENFAVTITNSLAATQAEVDAEEVRAMAAEAALQAEIDAEELRAAAAEAAIQAELDAEESRAMAAEAAIQAELDAAEAGAGLGSDGSYSPHASSTYIKSADFASASVTASLHNADKLLDIAIKAEVDARIADVDAEESRAMGVEAGLQAEIDAEEIRAAAAEAALDARLVTAEADIVSLEGRMDSAEGRLDVVEADLAAEIARATAAEGVLTSDLADEIARATAAELALDGRMTTAEADIVSLEGRMDSAEGRLDNLEGQTLYIADVVTRETPAGAVDGVNVEFTLAHDVVFGSEQIFLNGLLQEPGVGNDYTIVDNVITFNSAPITNDRVRVTYLKVKGS